MYKVKNTLKTNVYNNNNNNNSHLIKLKTTNEDSKNLQQYLCLTKILCVRSKNVDKQKYAKLQFKTINVKLSVPPPPQYQ